MADDFDFGFSAVSTEEFTKAQTTTEVQPSAVSSEEFDELKKKLDSISSLIQTLGDREDTSLFDETGEIIKTNGEKITRVEDKIHSVYERTSMYTYQKVMQMKMQCYLGDSDSTTDV